jgi:[ribosomal protein S18]-alanine N-acetyltransferase
MKDSIIIRDYKDSDKETVMSLFQFNTPQYFSPDEKKHLVYYLENEIEHYFIVQFNGQTVGSGGFNFSEDKTTGMISWDIFHPDYQGKSLGSTLLNYRIKRLKQFKQLQQITVRTSQLAYKFYGKSGFELIEMVEDYRAPGFHLYKMKYIE